mmetsp:Transcript_23454/g.60158  ORF Transcript_23454/g.60158 Transcript_23454/m.60158 type:complete len:201 (+) Transcript_23454:1514-2116(+)
MEDSQVEAVIGRALHCHHQLAVAVHDHPNVRVARRVVAGQRVGRAGRGVDADLGGGVLGAQDGFGVQPVRHHRLQAPAHAHDLQLPQLQLLHDLAAVLRIRHGAGGVGALGAASLPLPSMRAATQVVGIRRHAVQPRKADSQPRRNENRREHEKDAEADQQVSPQRGVPRAVFCGSAVCSRILIFGEVAQRVRRSSRLVP